MEGRDIASVVFSDAPVKLYLQARPDDRAERRATQRGEEPAGAVAAALDARDRLDSRTSPHGPTAGAVVLDTSVLDRDQTLAAALDVVREQAPEMIP